VPLNSFTHRGFINVAGKASGRNAQAKAEDQESQGVHC
jgi:hypothetical protein